MVDKRLEENIVQFCSVTGASTREARKFLETHKRLDVAMDAYYSSQQAFLSSGRRKGDSSVPSSSKILQLFEKYKDPEGEDITVDGTIKLCTDLKVNPEDVVLLAVAYELKSPEIGLWTKQGWLEGLKNIGVDSISEMKTALVRLRDQLGSNSFYFEKVYKHTFDLARNEGQRSLVLETAQAFWSLLIPHGFDGGALKRIETEDDDIDMDKGARTKAGDVDGWKKEYLQWWFDFLIERGDKGVTKDTWNMFLAFIRLANFSNHDTHGSWPSIIDDFVAYVNKRLATGA